MTLGSVLEHIEPLSRAVAMLPAAFRFQVFRPDAPIREWYSTWQATLFTAQRVSSPEVTSRFGVYLLATAREQKVVYVGKATPGARDDPKSYLTRYHLGAEIWAKVGHARFVDGDVQFVGGILEQKSRVSESDRAQARRGDILVAAVEVQPWECSSYVETYLQAVVCLAEGRLPDANDRIG
jgi:hypothetical protein